MTGPTPKPLAERFWSKVALAEDDACWEWLASKGGEGYGQIKAGGADRRMLGAHRVAWELLAGPIGDSLVIDHLCRNRGCVNPRHMQPVTNGENVRRGYAALPSAPQRRCDHDWSDPANVYVRSDGRGRSCRACRLKTRRTI